MADDKPWDRLIAGMPEERDGWRKFGLGLMLITAGFAFADWVTVRGHPEQDLPLWPAWIFAALACVGLMLIVASALALGPFRPGSTHRRR